MAWRSGVGVVKSGKATTVVVGFINDTDCLPVGHRSKCTEFAEIATKGIKVLEYNMLFIISTQSRLLAGSWSWKAA